MPKGSTLSVLKKNCSTQNKYNIVKDKISYPYAVSKTKVESKGENQVIDGSKRVFTLFGVIFKKKGQE